MPVNTGRREGGEVSYRQSFVVRRGLLCPAMQLVFPPARRNVSRTFQPASSPKQQRRYPVSDRHRLGFPFWALTRPDNTPTQLTRGLSVACPRGRGSDDKNMAADERR